MAVGTRVGGKGAGGGMFGREARSQFAAMAQMRWRIFIHGLRSIHGVLDLGATGIAWTFYAVLGIGFGTGLWVAAYSLASRGSWQYLPILFWVLSFLWLLLPVAVASFQEQSDLGILLRFPLRFGSYFLLYLISGLMDATTIVGVLCCLGIWLGIVMARPDLYLWTMLVLSVFAMFNILLVRAVFVWIERWLAQRKTREILGAVFMVLIVSVFLINGVWNQKRHEVTRSDKAEAEPLRETLDRYAPVLKPSKLVQQWLPPGLGARTLQQADEQEPAPAGASLGLLELWTVLVGSALAGRLRAQYRGQNFGWAPSRDQAIERRGGWRLGSSSHFSAIVEKEFLSLLRTVPLLWGVGVPVLFVLVMAGVFHHSPSGDTKSFPYAFPLCVAYALLGFTGLFYNNLGGEGAGIQLLFLSPTPIRTVLLAKNVFQSILFAVVAFAAAVLACVRLGGPPFVVLAGTAAWLVFALPCNLAAGIVLSLAIPYRINPGRITRPAGAQANTLPALLIQLGVLGVGMLVFSLSWSFNIRWVPIPIFLVLSVGAFLVWIRVLHYSNDNANQRRESLIANLMNAD
jgi:ABC-2 type transport system permease protein